MIKLATNHCHENSPKNENDDLGFLEKKQVGGINRKF